MHKTKKKEENGKFKRTNRKKEKEKYKYKYARLHFRGIFHFHIFIAVCFNRIDTPHFPCFQILGDEEDDDYSNQYENEETEVQTIAKNIILSGSIFLTVAKTLEGLTVLFTIVHDRCHRCNGNNYNIIIDVIKIIHVPKHNVPILATDEMFLLPPGRGLLEIMVSNN